MIASVAPILTKDEPGSALYRELFERLLQVVRRYFVCVWCVCACLLVTFVV